MNSVWSSLRAFRSCHVSSLCTLPPSLVEEHLSVTSLKQYREGNMRPSLLLIVCFFACTTVRAASEDTLRGRMERPQLGRNLRQNHRGERIAESQPSSASDSPSDRGAYPIYPSPAPSTSPRMSSTNPSSLHSVSTPPQAPRSRKGFSKVKAEVKKKAQKVGKTLKAWFGSSSTPDRHRRRPRRHDSRSGAWPLSPIRLS